MNAYCILKIVSMLLHHQAQTLFSVHKMLMYASTVKELSAILLNR